MLRLSRHVLFWFRSGFLCFAYKKHISRCFASKQFSRLFRRWLIECIESIVCIERRSLLDREARIPKPIKSIAESSSHTTYISNFLPKHTLRHDRSFMHSPYLLMLRVPSKSHGMCGAFAAWWPPHTLCDTAYMAAINWRPPTTLAAKYIGIRGGMWLLGIVGFSVFRDVYSHSITTVKYTRVLWKSPWNISLSQYTFLFWSVFESTQ